ncbi:MAG: adenylyl-sulfate kinase [Pirellulales bacterium]|nr:adenylyl-sulfate kinase [Pirellulales bacterium]
MKKPLEDLSEQRTNGAEEVDVRWHESTISRDQRETSAGHRGCVIWFTGLSGSGKSTLANEVDRQLHARGHRSFILDGDNVRHGLNASPKILETIHGQPFAKRFGLGFGPEDRQENIRRVGAVAELFTQAGIITLTAFISPYRSDREAVRKMLPAADFIEVYVKAPLDICESRDPKGLYKKARAGEISGFTGIDAPYEEPEKAEITVESTTKSPQVLAEQILVWLERAKVIPVR